MVSPENKIALDHELTYLVGEKRSRNKKSRGRGRRKGCCDAALFKFTCVNMHGADPL
jgi:hypothetical protein